MALRLDQIDRYQRQVLLPEWGAAGQERLLAATVTVGGGGPAAATLVRYLAGAGVGRLLIEDRGLWVRLAPEVAGLDPQIALPEHANRPSPDQPPAAPSPEEPARARWGELRLAAIEDRVASGAALAVEVIKAILGLPHRGAVSLPAASARAAGG